ncbi:Mutator protein MutT [Legionella gratiana]|uniref:8-oxo-dGTP diphosphatase n=1 Tax=Legionella gratiana TaxID=45066 RepID=A0A378JAA3_9GAMM|nr:8-oxo-dGTP diphosphatase MutT [Legionella gratiana]KTD15675.1 Mutator protein MutT [Legionella gratiana]STX44774.1 Mutator protein MutT [Legionella gratiana]
MNLTVAVAIIIDNQQRLLITQRPLHVSHGGCWEFPGGKLEENETSELALIREVKEEVDLEVHQYQLLGEVNHQYSDKSVTLIVFLVTHFSGEPSCMEGQLAMKWISLQELDPKDFPEANQYVIAMIYRHLIIEGTDDVNCLPLLSALQSPNH